MAETQKKRSPVVPAVLLVLLTGAGLAAAFYFLDGMTVVSDLWAQVSGGKPAAQPAKPTGSSGATGTAGSPELRLPAGVSQEFALRLWQEQVDSQENIKKLVNGEIVEMKIGKPSYDASSGSVPLTVTFKDGSSAPGELHMAKLGANWYVEYISGLRQGRTGRSADTVALNNVGKPKSPLPTLAAVDVGVLNTMFAEQADSQPVFEDYLDGNVLTVSITGVKTGPGTATVLATMREKQHDAEAQIIVLHREVGGKQMWFLARFDKLSEKPKT